MSAILSGIIATLGGAALQAVFPKEAPAIIADINAVLPAEKQITPEATGTDIQAAIADLPTEERLALLNREYDFRMAELDQETDVTQILANADIKGKTLRPSIAFLMAVVLIVNVEAYGYLLYQKALAGADVTWDQLSIVIGVPFAIVISYFGFLKNERTRIFEMVLNRTPAGALAGKGAEAVLNILKAKK